jgi:antitoxin component YwqK of YwqJK toxin-antitoxin module
VAQWEQGKETGQVQEFYKSQRLKSSYHLENGALDGLKKSYDPAGKIEYEQSYKNNRLDGPCKYYGRPGLQRIDYYKDDFLYKRQIYSGANRMEIEYNYTHKGEDGSI